MNETCPKGVPYAGCRKAWKLLSKEFDVKLSCETCNVEHMLPALISARSRDSKVAEVLQLMGMVDEAETFLDPTIRLTSSAAVCIFTELPVTVPCEDSGCPSWLPFDTALNCAVRYRELIGSGGEFSTSAIATALGLKTSAMAEKFNLVEWSVKELTLRELFTQTDDFEDHPSWVQRIEARFELPVHLILRRIKVSELAVAYSLREEQVQYLESLA